MTARKSKPVPTAPEYPPSIFDFDHSELNGRVPTADDPAPVIVRTRKLITDAWFLQIQDAAPSYVHRRLRGTIKDMALLPIVLLNTASSVARTANSPLPFRTVHDEPVYLSDLVAEITVAGRTATVGEVVKAADAAHAALMSIIVELPLRRPRDAYTVLEALFHRDGTLPPSTGRKVANKMGRFIADHIAGKPFRALPGGAR